MRFNSAAAWKLARVIAGSNPAYPLTNSRRGIMPKKEVWLSEETLNAIRKDLGIKAGDKDTGISEWIRNTVSEKLKREKYGKCFRCPNLCAEDVVYYPEGYCTKYASALYEGLNTDCLGCRV
jgi:hypothetical protein